MKIKNISKPKEFFERLQTCKGEVELVTDEGDRLNLKSKLCQLIFMTDIFNEAKLDDMELLFSNPEDAVLIFQYIMSN